jgi:hypothetical protein
MKLHSQGRVGLRADRNTGRHKYLILAGIPLIAGSYYFDQFYC